MEFKNQDSLKLILINLMNFYSQIVLYFIFLKITNLKGNMNSKKWNSKKVLLVFWEKKQY